MVISIRALDAFATETEGLSQLSHSRMRITQTVHVPQVVSLTLSVAFKFRECEVIRIEGEQTDVLEPSRFIFCVEGAQAH